MLILNFENEISSLAGGGATMGGRQRGEGEEPLAPPPHLAAVCPSWSPDD